MSKKIIFVSIIVFFIILGTAFFEVIKFSPVLLQLIFNKNISLKKADHRINILLLGTGGGVHEGPNLSDTIIFLSLDPILNKVYLISIPRDLWIPSLNAKINTAYATGLTQRKDGGLVLIKQVVSKVINQPIDYALKIDFDGFIKAVDLVGGLEVKVERSFDDYQYPDEEKREDLCGHALEEATELIATQSPYLVFPCRYQHIRFEKGLQHMEGKTALIFVRSRYALGIEGTDFARSQRQQKVIRSLKEKFLSLETVLNPVKIANIYSVLAKTIDTDIQQYEFDDFIKLAQKMKNASLKSTVIEVQDNQSTKDELLINPPLDEFKGAWVLIPRVGNGNFSEIQNYVQCVLTKDACPISPRYGKTKTNSR